MERKPRALAGRKLPTLLPDGVTVIGYFMGQILSQLGHLGIWEFAMSQLGHWDIEKSMSQLGHLGHRDALLGHFGCTSTR